MTLDQELALVRKAQAGDKAALGTLWDEITPKLFGYLMNVLRDRTVAEDVLQATWLRALEALPKFQPRGVRFSAWLFAIARNECRQHWRKSNREIASPTPETEPVNNDGQRLEAKILIDQVLAALSENDQELLRLRYIADLPVSDISRILNINSIAVRVRLHRAMARARALLTSNHP